MRPAIRAFALLTALALAAPVAAQPAAPAAAAAAAHRNAYEQAPAALLGAWKADVAASKYGGARPAANIRTFSYTDGGKVLVSSISQNAAGRISMLHWAVQLDGTPAPEFTDANASVPSSLVGLKKQDDQTFVMTVWRNGAVTLTGGFKLSPDGQTLTYTYGPTGTENNIVYRRLNMAG